MSCSIVHVYDFSPSVLHQSQYVQDQEHPAVAATEFVSRIFIVGALLHCSRAPPNH